MGKLLIGCYSYTSCNKYGTNHEDVLALLRSAVKIVDNWRTTHLPALEKGNAFQAIFVSPEYQFTDPMAPNVRMAMDEKTKQEVLKGLADISDTYPKILMFPGTVFWKEPLNTPENLKKFQAQLVAAELSKKGVGTGRTLLPSELKSKPSKMVDMGDSFRGKQVPSLKDLSGMVKHASTGYRVYNELYPFLAGKRLYPYRKQWDYKETEGASATEKAYVPGCSAGTKEIGRFEFGFEICFDHNQGGLKAKGKEVDFHVVVSDCVATTEANMMMKDGGYFIHASSNPGSTCVWERPGGMKKPVDPPLPTKADELGYCLVDVERRAGSQDGVISMPKTPVKLLRVA
jgi:predicted amidohydrolase